MPDAERDFLVEYLAARDVACPGCSYSLRGLKGGVCPECGQSLMLRVGLAEPRMGAWIFGLVGVAAGLGTSALLTTYFIVMVVRYGWPFMDGLPAFILLAGVPIGSVGLWAWIRLRRRVCRAGGHARWVCASGVSLLALAAPVAFLAMIR